MKKLFTLLFSALYFASIAQIPNPGFENWTSGNPDQWTTTNITGVATPVTQVTPAMSGSWALKGEVVNSLAGPMAPLVSSVDGSGNSFPVSQAYTYFSFYAKYHITGTGVFAVVVLMNDVNGTLVGSGGITLGGNQSSFTSIGIPIYYIGTNPATCTIMFNLADTVAATPNVGDYYIIDDLALSMATGLQNVSAAKEMAVYPNPTNEKAIIRYNLDAPARISISLYSVDGRMAKSLTGKHAQPGLQTEQFDVNDLSAGSYTVRLRDEEKGISKAARLVITH